MSTIDTWDECVKRYEYLRQNEHWAGLAAAMLALIDLIRKDKNFPDTIHTVSHAWLRLGPVVDDPVYRPGVWIGWRKPNYYWIGVGAFGTRQRITVSAGRVIPMLKRYLALLSRIDPEYAQLVPPESVTVENDTWSSNEVADKYAALTVSEVLPTLVDDVINQVNDILQSGENIHEMLANILGEPHELSEAKQVLQVLDDQLKRIQRISTLMNIGLERYHIGQWIRRLDDENREAEQLPTDPPGEAAVSVPGVDPVTTNGTTANPASPLTALPGLPVMPVVVPSVTGQPQEAEPVAGSINAGEPALPKRETLVMSLSRPHNGNGQKGQKRQNGHKG